MKQKKFVKFDGRLRNEALVKSTLGGIAIGGTAAFIPALVFWFLEFNGLWLTLAFFALAAIVGGAALYFTAFHPSVIQNARRLDRYGLDERLVTMVDLEGDESYIAQKQREDAMKALGELDAKRVKYRIPLAIVALAFALTVLFFEGITLEGLSEAELVPTGTETWLKIFPPPPPPEYDVEYLAGEGGTVEGDLDQDVTHGQNAEKVLAIANPGYMFIRWSDGETNPSRNDKDVQRNISVTALFIEVADDLDESEDLDEPTDAPGDEGQGEESLSNNNEGGDKYKEVNFVIDGQTYYRDKAVFDEYYEKMLEMLKNGETIPQEYKDLIELYFTVIK